MIHRVGSVPSTQDIAHDLAQHGAEDGTTVVAVRQQSGRGTRGRVWSSGPGGLWLSVILRPNAAPLLEGLSVRVGLEVAARLEPTLRPDQTIQLKWPNDLVAAGGKLGGILCEARWTGDRPGWVVVGVGLNVANQVAAAVAPGAVRLADLGGPSDPRELESCVRDAVLAAGRRSGPLSVDELAAFSRRHWLEGRRIETPVPGIVRSLRSDGRLLVRLDDGTDVAVLGPIAVPDLASTDRSH